MKLWVTNYNCGHFYTNLEHMFGLVPGILLLELQDNLNHVGLMW